MGDGKKDNKRDKLKEHHPRYLIDERYEIIEGVRYDFLSSPKYVHQNLLGKLHLAFHSACASDGKILMAPMDVHFDDINVFQPDIIYIANDNKGIIRDGFVFGVPNLVVEILSESTARRDKTIKKSGYEKFGVKEYWLADPIYKLVEQYVLVEGQYRLAATLTEEDRLVSVVVPCLTIELSVVFEDDL
ncbi:Uma2 family endonuclease [Paenibacillus sp. PAMC21692]|uniref:Uma2 family endonuclease n=1 Tax=Paenibacillus sp. PAMC21692 TaxID=2762320 RepID=UPI00164E230E|nr:Uma2 family endonuclease [Paenibacillus sp. PAMC21692]QNK60141.1 Uma2 family endonuclease [Paenibacillus sp. PAMC21692]